MDASEITYTAPLPGAVQRTLASKLAETVSVTDFGAVQDGDPVQTQAAFEAAISAVKDYANKRHHVLHVPAGYWNLNAKLQFYSNLTMVGAGDYATMFRFPNLSTPCLSMRDCHNSRVTDICINNGSPVPGSVAVDMTDSYKSYLDRSVLQDVDVGVWLYGTATKGAYYGKLSFVTVSGANRVGFLIDSAVDYSNSNEHTLFACQAHHSQIQFAFLRGNNIKVFSPNAETETVNNEMYLLDKVEDVCLVGGRAEKGGTGLGNVGVRETANTRRTVLVGGNFQNLTTNVVPAGQGITIVRSGYTPPVVLPPAQAGAAKYWGVIKTNSAVGGNYHTELRVEDANGPVTVAYSMMYEQTDLVGINWARLIDNDVSLPAFHTDSADPGATFKLNFGVPVELRKWKFYVNGPVTAKWDVIKSTDGVNWSVAATGLDCSGGAGWKEITW